MNIEQIPPGKNPPWDLNVLIEIPLGGVPVKYEIDKSSGALRVDRFLHTAMYYPGNYGFVPNTLSLDGDPIDVIVVGRVPVIAGCILQARPVGVLRMEDESGPDEKILAVPVTKLHPYYEDVREYTDLPAVMTDQILHFFTHYKDLENEKWVKVGGWESAASAAEAIEEAIARFK
ncbi:Inorganic pyrophosphatase [hydrothermal vent metagenome]|uniref:Inorganic pyrophosphatase n=1 Tax=hydrothermal vent metagenome TaxID=652676 RepID=A0A3B0S800_9ZZZZ